MIKPKDVCLMVTLLRQGDSNITIPDAVKIVKSIIKEVINDYDKDMFGVPIHQRRHVGVKDVMEG